MIFFYRKYVSSFLRQVFQKINNKCTLIIVRWRYVSALKRLKDKDKINCVFFALFEDVWKYDGVYQLMAKHPRFNPVILVCPIVNYGKDNMIDRMKSCYCSFEKRGYNVMLSYDKDTYIDVRKILEPDIIFYTNPYKGLIDDRYYIDNFKDVLTVYVPYYMNSNKDYQMACNLELHNLVWRRYSETEFHRQLSIKYSNNRGVNVVNTGYPGIEAYLNKKNIERKDCRKCIIWAPHHTIDNGGIISYSCFLKYCDIMVELAKKYSNEVVFVFKPHPILKNKLYEKWGKMKTDAYYDIWRHMENTTINEGDYKSLFLESDGMIHDSASFIIEYLYVNKPVMRTLNGEDLSVQFNSLGLQCIANHYLAYSTADIELFVQNVIRDVDPLKEQRTSFIKNILRPHGSPSQNIIDDIIYSIDNQVVYRN